MQIMSAFTTEGVLKSAEYISGEYTAIHKSIQEVMIPYYEDLREELAEERYQVREKHVKIIYPEIEEETERESSEKSTEMETEIETEEPDPIYIYPTVLRKINYIPENVIIAYLLMNDGIDTDNAKVNRWKLNSFIEKISEISESAVFDEDGTKIYWVENKLLTVNEIASRCFNNERDREKFSIMCEAYGEYFDVKYPTVILEDNSEIMVSVAMESQSNVPL